MEAKEFISLSKHKAQDLCEKRNLIFRLIRIDGNMFMDYPEDERDDRVCFELESGKVVKAVIQ